MPPANLAQKETKLDSPQKNSRKTKTSFEFLFYSRFDSVKNIKQNIRENIVLCWFYETSIKILRLNSKAQPKLLLICRQNFNHLSVKPILFSYFVLALIYML